MDTVSITLVLLIVVFGSVLLYWLALRMRSGRSIALRPINTFQTLTDQVGPAIESGRTIHFALGRASLVGSASPTSIAALAALDYLASDGVPKETPPLVTVGDGTLLPAGQDSLRQAFIATNGPRGFSTPMVQFLASETQPMTYAAGVSDIINSGGLASNIMIGRFGPEIAIIAEAAERQQMVQVIGSDDPVTLAVATTVTDQLLIGEEIFATGAYLWQTPRLLASLLFQDVMRVVIAVGILLAAILGLILGT